jgi:hypothetical protein
LIWGTDWAPSTITKILFKCANSIISLIGLISPITLVICAKEITLVFLVILFFKLSNVIVCSSVCFIYLTFIPCLLANSNQGNIFDACSLWDNNTSSLSFKYLSK